MASKREYLLQKGLQLKALTESVEGKTPPTSGSGTMTGKNAREVAKIRETCPPGTEDNVILSILAQTKGDPTKVSAAVSELWEDNRGHAQDEWATVEKKGKKKTEQPTSRREGGRSAPRSAQKQVAEEENPEGVERTSGERGSTRGRGAPASRGGRGGAGGRGRGSGRGFAPRSGTRTNNGEGEKSGESDETPDEQSTSKGDKSAKKGESKSKPAQVAVAPQPEVLNLTGAWTKKPTFLSAAKPVQAPAPAPKPAPKPVEKPAPAPSSPVKKAPPAPSTPVAPLSPVAIAVTSPKVLSPQTAASTSPKKVASPAPVSKVPEKILSPKKIDSPTPAISGWGSLDVSTASMGDWSTATTEKKTVPVTNAWARGSPLIASTDKPSPLAPSASPASPKEIRTEVSAGSNATSPKYLKLGRWDTGATTNMALQFGSFSLNNEQLDSKSPRGWASTTTSAPKPTTTSEAPNAWGTQSTSPKKAASSPKRTVESDSHGKANVGNNGPPGLSVESGRTTPKAALSPRSFAPSAPSPASLPKPDDVKRNTPTRAQGSFQNQTQSQPQSGSSKIGSGSSYGAEYNAKSANLYQPTYGQYAMGMSGPATTQSQISGPSNTPKGAAPRSSGPTSTSISSPTNSAQQAQQQFHAQQTQAQQPKPTQQQTQQVPQHQQQQQQQGHSQGPQQNPSQHHQQHAGPPGYHPHYAPPPPPGMAMAYNPYNNYANYYQGYGYYPNPQYAQYSPRAQYPPRGNVPYGVEGPMPGFPNPASLPVGYQDQHLAHQHDYAGAVPQGFGEISGGGYLQQPSHHHPHQQGPQNHGKGPSQVSSQPRSSGMQGYQSTAGGNARDQSTPGVATSANPSTGVNAGYGQQQQHYGWSGSYGGQPMGGWGHMGPQGYQQQNPSHQHPGSHQPQQSYRQYSGNQAQSGNSSNESGSGSGHGWSS